MDGLRAGEIRKINDHAHRRQPVHGVIISICIPPGGVDDSFAAGSGVGTAVEEGLDGGNARLPEGFVGKGQGVQVAPAPARRVRALQPAQLRRGLVERTVDKADRRRQLVSITPAGREAVAAFLVKPVKPSALFDSLCNVINNQVDGGQKKAAVSSFDENMGRNHPLRILLAEDNAVNQKVATSLLKRIGVRL